MVGERKGGGEEGGGKGRLCPACTSPSLDLYLPCSEPGAVPSLYLPFPEAGGGGAGRGA
jgi:hypothetical protein